MARSTGAILLVLLLSISEGVGSQIQANEKDETLNRAEFPEANSMVEVRLYLHVLGMKLQRGQLTQLTCVGTSDQAPARTRGHR